MHNDLRAQNHEIRLYTKLRLKMKIRQLLHCNVEILKYGAYYRFIGISWEEEIGRSVISLLIYQSS